MDPMTAKELLHANCYDKSFIDLFLALRCLCPLLHLQSEQARLGAAHDGCVVSSLLVESVTALVKGVNLRLAFCLVVPILGQAIWNWLVRSSGM
jgi:hypothetical protein